MNSVDTCEINGVTVSILGTSLQVGNSNVFDVIVRVYSSKGRLVGEYSLPPRSFYEVLGVVDVVPENSQWMRPGDFIWRRAQKLPPRFRYKPSRPTALDDPFYSYWSCYYDFKDYLEVVRGERIQL